MGLGSSTTTSARPGVCQHRGGTRMSSLVAPSPPPCLVPIWVSITAALMLPMASHCCPCFGGPISPPPWAFLGSSHPNGDTLPWALSASLVQQKYGIKPQMLLHLIKKPCGSGNPHGCHAKHPAQGATPKPDEDPLSSPAPHKGSAKGGTRLPPHGSLAHGCSSVSVSPVKHRYCCRNRELIKETLI